MAGEKRQRGGGSGGGRNGGEDRSAKRRRYAAAAGKSKAKAAAGEIRGPGLWLSCVRRKEAISTSEAYDMLNDVADRLYPGTSTQAMQGSSKDVDGGAAAENGDEDDIEAQIAKELEELQPTRDPETGLKKRMRFQSVRTDTECLVWISCAPPIDPVKMTYTIADELQNGAPVRTRFIQRITPVSNTTHADPNSLKSLAYRLLQPLIAPSDYTLEQRENDDPIKYRIEPNLRNHSASLNRQVVTDIIGEVVRDLANPSFQFQKRRVHEEEKPVAEGDQEKPVDGEVEAGATTAIATDEKDALPKETATLAQPEHKDETAETKEQQGEEAESTKEPKDEAEAEQSTEEPQQQEEETPWHILPAHRRRIYVDLKHPTHTILVSALRGVCGISVVERYDERKKFNVQMLSGTLPVRGNGQKDTEEPNVTTEEPPAATEEAALPEQPDQAAAPAVEIGTTDAEPEQPANISTV